MDHDRLGRRGERTKECNEMNSHDPNHFRSGQYRHGYRRPEGQGGPRPMAGTLAVRTLTSESLFLGDFEIGIYHGGALYRLKITRQGKLILNK